MQKKIEVVISVNDEGHAKLIRDDIERIIRERTTIYFVSQTQKPEKTIADYAREARPDLFEDNPE